MKKGLLAVLLAALFCFAGCAAQIVDFDETDLTGRGKAYTQDMLDGDFEAVAKDVAPSAALQLNAEALKKGWEETVAPLGGFEGITAVDFVDTLSSATVDVRCNFKSGGLRARYTFGADGLIAGLWLSYVPRVVEAENTDAYTESNVSIGTGAPLDGMLTLPRGVENPPVVLMVHGTGGQDMNETVGGCQPFADIAHGLAERGIASLRYNKRTAQYPGEPSDPKDLTIQYEVLDDAAAAVELLKNTDGVDAQRIYVLGHSFGGMLAPKIAQDNGLAGLISLAGSPRSLEDIMLDQNEAAAASGQLTAEQLEQAKASVEQAKNAKEGDMSPILGGTGHYWYTLNQVDTPAIVKSLEIPMLFVQGGADFQVSPEKDFNAWKELLTGKTNAGFQLYPGLTHLFTPVPDAPSNTPADYDAPAQVDPQVVADIAAWIAAQA